MMKPITREILLDSLTGLDDRVAKFICSATSCAPVALANGGYQVNAMVFSYCETSATASVWISRSGKHAMVRYLCGKDSSLEIDTEYENEAEAMRHFKSFAKSLYQQDESIWYWNSRPDWSKKSA